MDGQAVGATVPAQEVLPVPRPARRPSLLAPLLWVAIVTGGSATVAATVGVAASRLVGVAPEGPAAVALLACLAAATAVARWRLRRDRRRSIARTDAFEQLMVDQFGHGWDRNH